MALYDAQNTFSDDQAITATAASTNVLKVGPGDFGQGNDMDIDVIVTEAFNNLTTLKVGLRTDDNESMSSPTTLYETGLIPLASLAAGYKFPMRGVPAGCEKYIDLYYTVAGTAPTTGKLFASLTPVSQESNPSFT